MKTNINDLQALNLFLLNKVGVSIQFKKNIIMPDGTKINKSVAIWIALQASIQIAKAIAESELKNKSVDFDINQILTELKTYHDEKNGN